MESTDKIRRLNDLFRRGMANGKVVMTAAVAEYEPEDHLAIVRIVRAFSSFEEANDPYGEHDFGAFDFKGTKFFWKIDYYDAACEFGSEDAADASKTTRILTIMLASDY